KNVLKRGLIHVGALNLSLVMRQLLGKGSSSQQNETTSATGAARGRFQYGISHTLRKNISPCPIYLVAFSRTGRADRVLRPLPSSRLIAVDKISDELQFLGAALRAPIALLQIHNCA